MQAELTHANRQQRNTCDHRDLVERIFSKLTAVMGRKFTSNWATPEMLLAAKSAWAQALAEENVTLEQARLATDRACKSGGWAPDLGTFLQLCKPTIESLGIPSCHCAYRAACRAVNEIGERDWLHPAVYHTAKVVGFYELKTFAEKISRPIFEREYQKTVDRIIRGENIDPIPQSLPPPPQKHFDKETAQKNIQKLKEILS